MSLNESLDRVLTRYKELEALMSDGSAGGEKIAKLGKEYSDLGPVVEAVNAYRKAQSEAQGMADLLADPATDPDMRELAEEEFRELKETLPDLERQVQVMLLPKD